MKHFRKASLRTLLLSAFVCAGASGVAGAEVSDARVISARAGGVNFVAGDVKVRRAASADWDALSVGDELKSGDAVRTGPAGRVEVLLNPGSYFRAGRSTEFTLTSANLEDLQVELARGSAVVEATGYGDMKLFLQVSMPGALVKIERSGVYRLNAPAGGPPEVAVVKGRAVVGGAPVKGGKAARASGAGVEVVKFDKDSRDELDQWSRDRGKELAKANEKLSHRALRSAFGSRGFDAGFGRWGSPHGFWFFNAGLRCYTFLPYGLGWRSPYGYGYNTGVMPSPRGGWTTGHNAPGGAGSNPRGGTWGGGPGSGGGGVGSSPRPAHPTPVTRPSRVEPAERPMRQRTIEPGFRP